jgi:hypothetical protein
LKKGKGNRVPGSQEEDFSVMLSISNLSELRKEWKDVEIVFIDEASLLSEQLLGDIDYTLRYVKENFDEYFGGTSIIFSGDFYQFPPVAGTALWVPIPSAINSSTTEVQKRLGRIAWKSVDTVLDFNEQQRMKDDPGYAEAVLRLRTRTCTFDDVDLFNSRLIRSETHPNGVNLGTPENLLAAAIVNTNHIREELNYHKCVSNAKMKNQLLLICCARDLNRDTNSHISNEHRQHLLKLDTSAFTGNGALPGVLALYIDMPIILRMRNLSTDLGISNGSQGYLKKLVTESLEDGTTVPKLAIVDFPSSKVKLDGLPVGYFLIEPISWSFSTPIKVNGSQTMLRIRRYQLPIQPAFSVTGQSAQGKTLPSVLASLHEGGFSAYVAASRAKTRQGLCVLQPVQLSDLNKPLPHDLLIEAQRLEALEQNTYVRYGFKTGYITAVPDPESEIAISYPSPKLSFPQSNATRDSPCTQSVGSKRKFVNSFNEPPALKRAHIENDTPTKQLKRQGISTSVSSRAKKQKITHLQPGDGGHSRFWVNGGCRWSSTNWSCAYDCIVTCLATIYFNESSDWRHTWQRESETSQYLSHAFDDIRPSFFSEESCSAQLTRVRDNFRDLLSAQNPLLFPRTGSVGAAVTDILHAIVPDSTRELTSTPSNEDSGNAMSRINAPATLQPIEFPTVLPSTHTTNDSTRNDGHIQTFINNFQQLTGSGHSSRANEDLSTSTPTGTL